VQREAPRQIARETPAASGDGADARALGRPAGAREKTDAETARVAIETPVPDLPPALAQARADARAEAAETEETAEAEMRAPAAAVPSAATAAPATAPPSADPPAAPPPLAGAAASTRRDDRDAAGPQVFAGAETPVRAARTPADEPRRIALSTAAPTALAASDAARPLVLEVPVPERWTRTGGALAVRVRDASGQRELREVIALAPGRSTADFRIPAGWLTAGRYAIEIGAPDQPPLARCALDVAAPADR
jgi:hypothetical protein